MQTSAARHGKKRAKIRPERVVHKIKDRGPPLRQKKLNPFSKETKKEAPKKGLFRLCTAKEKKKSQREKEKDILCNVGQRADLPDRFSRPDGEKKTGLVLKEREGKGKAEGAKEHNKEACRVKEEEPWEKAWASEFHGGFPYNRPERERKDQNWDWA